MNEVKLTGKGQPIEQCWKSATAAAAADSDDLVFSCRSAEW